MPPPLMLSRRFAPLFWCQFFAAFNDNFLKTALVFLILFRSGAADAEALITLASAIFIAPYFFLSALGGEVADRLDKARVAQWLKFFEIFVAALAVLGFALQSVPVLFGALACFGVIAALFGPIKYGARNCPPAMRWWKARPLSPSSPAPSSVGLPRAVAAMLWVSRRW